MKPNIKKPVISKIKRLGVDFPKWQVQGEVFGYKIYGFGDTIESAWEDYREVLQYELDEGT